MTPTWVEKLLLRLLAYGLFVSLLLSQNQLRFSGLVFYPPELIIYPVLAILLVVPQTRVRLVAVYRDLTPAVKLSLGLVLAGSVIGTIVSPLFPTSVGAFKAWVISPLAVSWMLAAFYKNQSKIIIEGITLFGLLIAGITYYQLIQHGDLTRATAYFNSPNTLAAIVGPISILAFWQGQQTGRKWWYLAGVVLLGSLLLSRSLGGLIGVGGALLFSFRYLSRGWKYAVAVLLIAGTIGSFTILHGRTEGTENSLSGREQIWTVATYIVKAWPVTGAGLRGFEYHYPHVIGGLVEHPQEWAAVPQPHNIVLAVWIGTGLFGLLGFLGLLYYLLVWRGVPTPAHLALVAILFHGLIDTPYWRVDLNILFWAYVALLWLSSRQSPSEEELNG